MNQILQEGVNGNDQGKLDSGEWFKKLLEDIRENLLSDMAMARLISDPMDFLLDYVKDETIAGEIYDQIIRSFFHSMLETMEREKNQQKILADFALDALDDKLTDTDSISAVDMSQIFKNLKD